MTAPRFSTAQLDAVLFDLDGVVTDTARVHARCWKRVFDELLERRAKATGDAFRPFDLDADYRRYVDGKPRRDGVRDFLRSRGIRLPEEVSEAADGADSVSSVAQRKDALFGEALAAEGVEVYPGTLRWIEHLRGEGLRLAVVSASRHCAEVLQAAGLESVFDARVDGHVADRLHLRGKPAPDVFLEAARVLGVESGRAAVVEDALAGVEAGRAGGFAWVVGVARRDNAAELMAAGAHVAVRDLAELHP